MFGKSAGDVPTAVLQCCYFLTTGVCGRRGVVIGDWAVGGAVAGSLTRSQGMSTTPLFPELQSIVHLSEMNLTMTAGIRSPTGGWCAAAIAPGSRVESLLVPRSDSPPDSVDIDRLRNACSISHSDIRPPVSVCPCVKPVYEHRV